jgi:adenine-specific DNA-methyltransferase
VWTDVKLIDSAFEQLIKQFEDSILVISYRSDGIPSIERLTQILTNHGKSVEIHESADMKYALSIKKSSEILIVAK